MAETDQKTKILCLGTTPAAQRVMVFGTLKLNVVNRAVETLDSSAGKSVNVAKVLKTLGGHPVAVGFLGGSRGERIRADLRTRGIEEHFVMVPEPTRQCVTVIDLKQRQQTELVEESRPVAASAFAPLMAAIQRLLPLCQALVMSGTVVPGGPVGFYRDCVALAAAAGVLSILDAQGNALLDALPARPGLVKPNRTELAASVGRPLSKETDTMAAMRELHERGAQQVVVTAGTHPALAFDGRIFWRIHAPVIQARNPIGSGDAFTAAMTARLVCGDNLGEACRWGAAAGATNALSYLPGEVECRQVTALLDIARAEKLAE